MNWEEVARDSFKDQLPAIELFIESVNKSVDEHDRERELVQHFSPLKARDQLKELLPPMRRASHKLASLEAGTRSLTKLLAWNAELGTHENLGDELNDMQHLHDRWLQHFEQVYEILKKKDAFKGDKNPQTYARLRFQKMIFVFYMAAFELESPPTYSDRKFREVFEAIMVSKGLPCENLPQTFKEILSYFRSQ